MEAGSQREKNHKASGNTFSVKARHVQSENIINITKNGMQGFVSRNSILEFSKTQSNSGHQFIRYW